MKRRGQYAKADTRPRLPEGSAKQAAEPVRPERARPVRATWFQREIYPRPSKSPAQDAQLLVCAKAAGDGEAHQLLRDLQRRHGNRHLQHVLDIARKQQAEPRGVRGTKLSVNRESIAPQHPGTAVPLIKGKLQAVVAAQPLRRPGMSEGRNAILRLPAKRGRKKGASAQRSTNIRAIRREILDSYPWLRRLDNYAGLVTTFSKVLSNRRKIQALWSRIARLGESILSEHARERKRLAAKIDRYRDRNSALNSTVGVNVIPLLNIDVFPDPAKGRVHAGRAALVYDLKQRGGYLKVEDPLGVSDVKEAINFYLRPSWRVHVDADGIHLTTLLQIQTLSVGIYMKALLEEQLRLTETFLAQPWVKEILAIAAVRRSKEQALGGPRESAQEREIRDIIAERKRYAREVREEYVRAAAVPATVLGIFAINGPVDLLLTVFPVGKLGKVAKAGKRLIGMANEGRKTRKALKAYKAFLENLGDDYIQFVKLAEKLSKRQVLAVKALRGSGASPELVSLLMRRAVRDRTVSLSWVARMIKTRKMDLKFVERFTTYEAKPRWDILQKIVEKKAVSQDARDALVRKMYGLFGEEAATRILRGRGQKLIGRGYYYSGKRSIDVVTQLRSGRFAFGEVKTWGRGTWEKRYREVIEQLKEHNQGVAKFVEKIGGDIKKDVGRKYLLVKKEGYEALDITKRAILEAEIKDLGWRLEYIPSASIQDFGKFIDSLR